MNRFIFFKNIILDLDINKVTSREDIRPDTSHDQAG